MKKVKLIIATVAFLGLATSPTVYADSFAPGEGMYIGAFVGHAAGHVSAKVKATEMAGQCGFSCTTSTTSTVEITDGGLALNGVEGGGWLGYGYKMGDLYVGFETDFAGGGGKFKVDSDKLLDTTNNDVTVANLGSVSAEMEWSGGAAARLGYYVNQDTLFAIKMGISAAKFEAKWGSESEKFYGGGPALGASLQSRISAIDPNLSIKLAANYVDYLTAPVKSIGSISSDSDNTTKSEVSGAAYNARLGVAYSFFDMNSLF